MTAKEAKHLKHGDKVIPKYDAWEIGKYGKPCVKTVDYVSYDPYGFEYRIVTTDGRSRGHKHMKLVTEG